MTEDELSFIDQWCHDDVRMEDALRPAAAHENEIRRSFRALVAEIRRLQAERVCNVCGGPMRAACTGFCERDD